MSFFIFGIKNLGKTPRALVRKQHSKHDKLLTFT